MEMQKQKNTSFILTALFVYLLLIVYGTLYPIAQWDWSLGNWSKFLTLKVPEHVSYADLVMNFIIYIPFGLLFFLALPSSKKTSGKVFLITLLGFCLSTCLEYFQQFLPGRTSSLSDIFLNTVGSMLGALTAQLLAKRQTRTFLTNWQQQHLSHTPYSLLGLVAALLWGASQLVPFVPSLEISNLRQGLAPLWHTLNSPDTFKFSKFIIYLLNISAILLILRSSLKKNASSTRLIFIFVLLILLLKVPVLTRQLSLEAVSAFFVGLLIYSLFYQLKVSIQKTAALVMLVIAYAYSTLLAGNPDLPTRPMNWIPFSQQMNTLVGIADLIEQIAVFSAFAYVLTPKTAKPGKRYFIITGSFILLFAFSLEWLQQFKAGRYSDITDVIIAFSAWSACMLYPWNRQTPVTNTLARETNHSSGFAIKPKYLLAAIISLILIGGLTFIIKGPTAPDYHYQLPEISELPEVNLPYFKQQHPRLPAPTTNDIQQLETHNPSFFWQHKRRAKRGDLYSQTLLAYIYPGSIDLTQLFNKIIKLEPAWRGHQQTKPIALAYDWLYSQWTPSQRQQLRNKVKEACEYEIKIIRDSMKLSPYNVYLYNSPFQALITASLALHKDIPETEDTCMRFTYDYWVNRVVPVWKQVMGKNGGWHEGGEYIGIGIGQAIYQVPAMWRAATGEDYFKQIPGIRGFLDFLVYRIRPDGTHFRWGDAGFFDRNIPDRLPLAIEFRHKAAYNIKPPSKIIPTSWPWGPLTDPSLIDKHANQILPLTKIFDGIGLIVSRSSWDKDATYVTFKAGDNYWSHSHLDQGSFTIFKGGALAIDSGLYGPKYGSDHHMNYTYQSIAHNIVTVTDPDDTIPRPVKKKKNSKKQKPPREIANDGGQRRIGSGWGKSAPLDLQDWLNQSDIYHTATLEKVIEKDNVIMAIADLTPAYTNSLSGEGTFAHRTRRVKRYQRVFVYDKNNDLIIIFDKINAYKASFRKKWLLHSLQEPLIKNNFFTIKTPANPKTRMPGGSLKGQILLPQKPLVNKIGGKGMEFYIDGVNYDENGLVFKHAQRKRNVEPGHWRIEVEPSVSHKEDLFLVALQPALLDKNKPLPQITAYKKGQTVYCEITGKRQLKITFAQDLSNSSFQSTF